MTLPLVACIAIVVMGMIFGYGLGKHIMKGTYDGIFFIDRTDPNRDKIAIRWDTMSFDYLDDGDIVQLEVKIVNDIEREIENEDN